MHSSADTAEYFALRQQAADLGAELDAAAAAATLLHDMAHDDAARCDALLADAEGRCRAEVAATERAVRDLLAMDAPAPSPSPSRGR